MKTAKKRKMTPKPITAKELDRKFDAGEDVMPYFDWDKAVFVRVKRVNVDFPEWMIRRLDEEAVKLNVSRQAIIKMWLSERLDPKHRFTR